DSRQMKEIPQKGMQEKDTRIKFCFLRKNVLTNGAKTHNIFIYKPTPHRRGANQNGTGKGKGHSQRAV
ncbi:MAG: hypothetical protein IJY28_10120, partial [Clostridia bacterium]|nr:hypothetical protein [Clostridia bacterium]